MAILTWMSTNRMAWPSSPRTCTSVFFFFFLSWGCSTTDDHPRNSGTLRCCQAACPGMAIPIPRPLLSRKGHGWYVLLLFFSLVKKKVHFCVLASLYDDDLIFPYARSRLGRSYQIEVPDEGGVDLSAPSVRPRNSRIRLNEVDIPEQVLWTPLPSAVHDSEHQQDRDDDAGRTSLP